MVEYRAAFNVDQTLFNHWISLWSNDTVRINTVILLKLLYGLLCIIPEISICINWIGQCSKFSLKNPYLISVHTIWTVKFRTSWGLLFLLLLDLFSQAKDHVFKFWNLICIVKNLIWVCYFSGQNFLKTLFKVSQLGLLFSLGIKINYSFLKKLVDDSS